MKRITKKVVSLFAAAATFGSAFLSTGALGTQKQINAAAGTSYTASKQYYFNEVNCGYYTEPTASGTYQTAIIIHGSGSDCSSWMAQQMPVAMEYWTKQGYLQPMNIFMPWIAHQAKNDDWGVLAHRDFAMNYADDLALSIETITDKADTKKYKTAIAGYSMGGCDALTAAALNPDLFTEVGSLSSSYTFYKYDDPNNAWSNFHNTSDMNFAKDLRCYITYGAVEAQKDTENIFEPSANCYYKILTQTKGLKNIVGPYKCQDTSWGKHGNRLFFREIFMYLYFLQNGKAPSEALTEEACKSVYKDYGTWSTLKKPTKQNNPLTVSAAKSDKTNVVFGESYTVSVQAQGGDGNYKYDWQFSLQKNGTYTSTSRTDKNGKSLNGKSSLLIADATRDIYYRCVVKDGKGAVVKSEPVRINVAPKINSISSTGYGVS